MAEGPTGTLKITVVPAEVHATVTVVAAPDSVWRRTQRQPDGIYLFEHLPVGQYDIAVESRGYVTAWRREVNVNANQATEVSITLKLGATISGTVSPPGRAILVTAEGYINGREYGAFADPTTGHYELNGLPPGEYDLAFAWRGRAIRGLPPFPPNTMTKSSSQALAEFVRRWAACESDGGPSLADRLRLYSRSYRSLDQSYDTLAQQFSEVEKQEAEEAAAEGPPSYDTVLRTTRKIVRVGGDDTRAVVLVHTKEVESWRASGKVEHNMEYDEVVYLVREVGEWKIVGDRTADGPDNLHVKHVSLVFSKAIAAIKVVAGKESTGHDVALPANWFNPKHVSPKGSRDRGQKGPRRK
jgi:hypothetical protein